MSETATKDPKMANTEEKSDLKIDKTYPFISAKVAKIVIVGCGGTGSYLVPAISRSITVNGKGTSLLLIDGDNVEEKNLKRQNFIAADVGKNKAEVLCARYASAFGIAISMLDKYVESVDKFREIITNETLVITCVDNIKTRLMVKEAISKITEGAVYWIDCGNEEFTGQVVMSASVPWWKPSDLIDTGLYPMPDVFDLYPELFERANTDKLPTELSCAEMAVSSPQYGFVNMLAATLAMNYAHDLMTRGPIKTHKVDFSVKNKYSHKSLTESEITGWIKTFKPFNSFKLFEQNRRLEELKKISNKDNVVDILREHLKSALGKEVVKNV